MLCWANQVPQVAIMAKDDPLAQMDDLSIADFEGKRIITSTRSDPSYHYFAQLWADNGISVKTVLQSPFANFAIQMVETMSAVTFNNALVAKRICGREANLVMKPIVGVDLKTPFYLACADWQKDSDTGVMLSEAFCRNHEV